MGTPVFNALLALLVRQAIQIVFKHALLVFADEEGIDGAASMALDHLDGIHENAGIIGAIAGGVVGGIAVERYVITPTSYAKGTPELSIIVPRAPLMATERSELVRVVLAYSSACVTVSENRLTPKNKNSATKAQSAAIYLLLNFKNIASLLFKAHLCGANLRLSP